MSLVVLDDLEVRVAHRGDQLLKDVVASTSANAESSRGPETAPSVEGQQRDSLAP
jgi:hypothetical protein